VGLLTVQELLVVGFVLALAVAVAVVVVTVLIVTASYSSSVAAEWFESPAQCACGVYSEQFCLQHVQ
jgi:hypothetical protein